MDEPMDVDMCGKRGLDEDYSDSLPPKKQCIRNQAESDQITAMFDKLHGSSLVELRRTRRPGTRFEELKHNYKTPPAFNARESMREIARVRTQQARCQVTVSRRRINGGPSVDNLHIVTPWPIPNLSHIINWNGPYTIIDSMGQFVYEIFFSVVPADSMLGIGNRTSIEHDSVQESGRPDSTLTQDEFMRVLFRVIGLYAGSSDLALRCLCRNINEGHCYDLLYNLGKTSNMLAITNSV